jgi:two-component system, NarL family, invasion response regulator UvrY
LSNREYQIFLLIAAGEGSTDIAERLNLSVKTVSTHKARIKNKMKLDNTSEFVRYALKYKLIAEAGG